MRLPPSPRRPERRRGGASCGGLLAVFFLLGIGCAGGRDSRGTVPRLTVVRAASLPEAERPFLADPLETYPLVADPELAAETSAAFRRLLESGDADAAAADAARLLAADAGYHPGAVLLAQAQIVQGRPAAAVQRLEQVVGELPDYGAARLALGRAAELAGFGLLAFESYLVAAPASPAAAERLEQLQPRALEMVYNRLQDALARGRFDAAEDAVERLKAWAPEDPLPWTASRELALALKEPEVELEAVRQLESFFPEDRSLAARRAELEVAVGDPGEGVKILRRLTAAHPDDPQLAASLERAQFRWRLRMLPQRVHELVARPELTRADFAVLLFWVVPGVRYGRVQAGRIAEDILDHDDREAIARVINLGLMDVEENLHRFKPSEPLQRADALSGLLRYLQGLDPGPACLGPAVVQVASSLDTVCSLAASCGLTPSAADCLPRAAVGGEEALEMVRRALRLSGAP